jgi:hypothetical protein
MEQYFTFQVSYECNTKNACYVKLILYSNSSVNFYKDMIEEAIQTRYFPKKKKDNEYIPYKCYFYSVNASQ